MVSVMIDALTAEAEQRQREEKRQIRALLEEAATLLFELEPECAAFVWNHSPAWYDDERLNAVEMEPAFLVSGQWYGPGMGQHMADNTLDGLQGGFGDEELPGPSYREVDALLRAMAPDLERFFSPGVYDSCTVVVTREGITLAECTYGDMYW